MTAAQKAATITKPTDREIKVERIFDAPRDVVFATFTNPGTKTKRAGRAPRTPRAPVRPRSATPLSRTPEIEAATL